MNCATCKDRGYTGRGPTLDACPDCAFEAEIEWRERNPNGVPPNWRKLGDIVKFPVRRRGAE